MRHRPRRPGGAEIAPVVATAYTGHRATLSWSADGQPPWSRTTFLPLSLTPCSAAATSRRSPGAGLADCAAGLLTRRQPRAEARGRGRRPPPAGPRLRPGRQPAAGLGGVLRPHAPAREPALRPALRAVAPRRGPPAARRVP